MALPKLFQRIFWHNNTTPAINEDNLNAMSKGLDDVDDRLIALAGTIMEDVPAIQHDLEILEPAIENIDANVERAETAADNAEEEALKSEGYAVGTQDGVEVTSGEYYQNNAKYYAEIANPPIENTVDFTDVITISDAINKAAKDVRLKVEAVQDLHGYDKPWVGGAGKNKLPMTLSGLKAANTSGTWSGNAYTRNGVTFTVLVDNDNNVVGIKANNTASANADFNLCAASDYSALAEKILNGCPSGGGASTYSIFLALSSSPWTSYGNDTGSGVTLGAVPSGSNTIAFIRVANGYNANNVLFYPMVSDNGGAFESYTNICPITGWDNAKVTRGGKNLLSLTLASLKANNPSDASKTWDGNKYTYNGVEFTPVLDSNGNLLYINVNTTENTHAAAYFFVYGSNAQSQPNIFKGMKLSGCPSGGSSSTYSLVWQSYETQIVYPQHFSGSDVGAGTTISEDAYTRMYISIPANSVLDNVKFYPMIRLATVSDATYEPYQGEEITISLGGTRYGGTLDVTSGVLTLLGVLLTKNTATMDNSDNWPGWTNAGIRSLIGGGINRVFTDQMLNVGTTFGANTIGVNGDSLLLPKDYYGKTQTEWIALALDVQILVMLATPQTIQLTPTQVYLLYGYNTLFGDCGDISLTYDASGIIHIEEAKLDTETLKTIAAASSDFADFKARIAAL